MPIPINDTTLAVAIRAEAHPLHGIAEDFDPLLKLINDRVRFVLIGEASHGTHEFYSARAEITKRLMTEKGFTAVVAEADWPNAYRVNRYARGQPAGPGGATTEPDAESALGDFQRFPLWMWRNTVVRDFVEWLRDHNAGQPAARQAGFYGMDLYSLYSSAEAVLKYLDRVDPEASKRARYRYGCFEQFGEDTQAYGYAASFGLSETCEREALEQLVEMQRRASEYASRDGRVAEDEQFFAEQNARLVMNAEEYYRTMFRGKVSSWNLRDQHMVETLDALAQHLDKRVGGGHSKLVVWAHNSHLGDARATEMGEAGEWNVGQLVRERWGVERSLLVGFSTYTGTVTAASNWDEPAQLKRVRPGLPGSYEELFHAVGVPRFLLTMREDGTAVEGLRQERIERAIGVIYRPETERLSHYFQARLPDQFDAVLHYDETRALEPLDETAGWEHPREAPETYPFAV